MLTQTLVILYEPTLASHSLVVNAINTLLIYHC